VLASLVKNSSEGGRSCCHLDSEIRIINFGNGQLVIILKIILFRPIDKEHDHFGESTVKAPLEEDQWRLVHSAVRYSTTGVKALRLRDGCFVTYGFVRMEFTGRRSEDFCRACVPVLLQKKEKGTLGFW
jgi:hypothetical protein